MRFIGATPTANIRHPPVCKPGTLEIQLSDVLPPRDSPLSLIPLATFGRFSPVWPVFRQIAMVFGRIGN
jgi:hypothetical protein